MSETTKKDNEMWDDKEYWSDAEDMGEETEPCLKCDGEGFILTCCDDMCHGLGYCIHGDGEMVCPTCKGGGW